MSGRRRLTTAVAVVAMVVAWFGHVPVARAELSITEFPVPSVYGPGPMAAGPDGDA